MRMPRRRTRNSNRCFSAARKKTSWLESDRLDRSNRLRGAERPFFARLEGTASDFVWDALGRVLVSGLSFGQISRFCRVLRLEEGKRLPYLCESSRAGLRNEEQVVCACEKSEQHDKHEQLACPARLWRNLGFLQIGKGWI